MGFVCGLAAMAFAGFIYWKGDWIAAAFLANMAFTILVILAVESQVKSIEKQLDRVWEEVVRLKQQLPAQR